MGFSNENTEKRLDVVVPIYESDVGLWAMLLQPGIDPATLIRGLALKGLSAATKDLTEECRSPKILDAMVKECNGKTNSSCSGSAALEKIASAITELTLANRDMTVALTTALTTVLTAKEDNSVLFDPLYAAGLPEIPRAAEEDVALVDCSPSPDPQDEHPIIEFIIPDEFDIND